MWESEQHRSTTGFRYCSAHQCGRPEAGVMGRGINGRGTRPLYAAKALEGMGSAARMLAQRCSAGHGAAAAERGCRAVNAWSLALSERHLRVMLCVGRRRNVYGCERQRAAYRLSRDSRRSWRGWHAPGQVCRTQPQERDLHAPGREARGLHDGQRSGQAGKVPAHPAGGQLRYRKQQRRHSDGVEVLQRVRKL